jgi:hypothetical protein
MTTSDDSKDSNNTINITMAKSSNKSMASATAEKFPKKSSNKKTTGMDAININTPLRKKPHATTTASRYSINIMCRLTINPYTKGSKNKVDIIPHEGSVPPNNAQPHVTLLSGGMTLSIQWKAPEKLYTKQQATTQKIRRESAHFMGYSNTMQLMRNNGVTPMEGYHRGAPQIIHLDVKCTGDPKVKHWKVLTKVRVYHDKKEHKQFNMMYVCTMKVARGRHGLTVQPEDAGLWTLASLGAKTVQSPSMDVELARGWRWRTVAVTGLVRRTTRNGLHILFHHSDIIYLY